MCCRLMIVWHSLDKMKLILNLEIVLRGHRACHLSGNFISFICIFIRHKSQHKTMKENRYKLKLVFSGAQLIKIFNKTIRNFCRTFYLDKFSKIVQSNTIPQICIIFGIHLENFYNNHIITSIHHMNTPLREGSQFYNLGQKFCFRKPDQP